MNIAMHLSCILDYIEFVATVRLLFMVGLWNKREVY